MFRNERVDRGGLREGGFDGGNVSQRGAASLGVWRRAGEARRSSARLRRGRVCAAQARGLIHVTVAVVVVEKS